MDHGFYNLDEAKVKLGCTNNDLLKLGAEGKIELHIWYNGMDYWADALCPLSFITEFLPISKDDIMQVYLENKGVPPSQPITQITLKYKNFPMLISGSFFLTTKTLFLSSKTLEAINTDFPNSPTEKVVYDSTCSNSPTPQGEPLVGWKAIAKHLCVSISTAKRYAKKGGHHLVWPGPTGSPTTTTVLLDKWRLSSPPKKKKMVTFYPVLRFLWPTFDYGLTHL